MSDRMFNRLHFSAQGMLRAGAGLVLMVLGSAATAQSVANGKVLYVQKACSSSGCHEADPTRNANGILTAAINNGAFIQTFCDTEREMIPICSAATGQIKISAKEAADIAAYVANPNAKFPAATLSTDALAFRRSVNGNQSGKQTVTLTNTGDANLVLTTVALSGGAAADYKLFAPAAGAQCTNGSTIAPKAACSVDITFDPPAAGARNAELNFTPDAAAGIAAVKVALNGTGTAVAEALPTANVSNVDFGNQLLNIASGNKTVVVTNNGEANLTFDAGSSFFTLSGANAAEYTLDTASSADGCTAAGNLAVGASCKLQLKFTPTAIGNRAATLTVNSNSTDVVVNLSGTGVNADANNGGGGCSMIDPSKNSAVDPTLLGLGALALAVLGLRRRRNHRQ